jgi:NgoMIV restriction enzyme
MADISNKLSVKISKALVEALPYTICNVPIKSQTAGLMLERLTRNFLQEAFVLLKHLRPGKWTFSLHDKISDFDQFEHLTTLTDLLDKNPILKTVLGDYIIGPDIIVGKQPMDDRELNKYKILASDKILPRFTPLRSRNVPKRTLHASISCKWTLRSDRSQNARTEGLNLVRSRKGKTPHIAVVTGEPMPSRIASLALGTGDIDCVYHFALHELIEAVGKTRDATAIDMLSNMVEGRRLRDIADLPFDLAL